MGRFGSLHGLFPAGLVVHNQGHMKASPFDVSRPPRSEARAAKPCSATVSAAGTWCPPALVKRSSWMPMPAAASIFVFPTQVGARKRRPECGPLMVARGARLSQGVRLLWSLFSGLIIEPG